MTARDDLVAWVKANPLAPRQRRVLAQRLLAYPSPAMWEGVSDGVRLFSAAQQAWQQSRAEVSRPTATEEAAGLQRVEHAISELRSAVEESPLPTPWAAGGYCLTAADLPDMELLIGWRETPAAGGYSISVVDVLDIASEMLDAHRARLPIRTVERHRRRPVAASFVRRFQRLAKRFELRLTHSAIADVGNASLDLRGGDVLTAKTVGDILKPAPERIKGTAEQR